LGCQNGVPPRSTVNTIIEIHDSTIAAIARVGATVVVHFQPAYLHKSEGRPGVDPGTGWVQEVRLIFADAAISGDWPELPCDVMDGEMTVGGERYPNWIPVPFATPKLAELRLVCDDFHTVTVEGRGVTLELIGEPRFIEEVK